MNVEIAAPEILYKPPTARHYNPPIGLIGCGGIVNQHLASYNDVGFNVVALRDVDAKRAEGMRNRYYPGAAVFADHHALLKRGDIEGVDVATHPQHRAPILDAAIDAGKHVLSQKPFVLDLAMGEQLVERAEKQGVKIAVNQNGRWAPHFSYMREAIKAGLIGDVTSVSCTMNWDHTWIAGTDFEKIHHVILYDFAIHWMDILLQFLKADARRVFAAVTRVLGQTVTPPMVAKVLVEFDEALANLSFNGLSAFGPSDRTTIVGTKGTFQSFRPNLGEQSIEIFTEAGYTKPRLEGKWFPDGFRGTMGELLSAIEQGREPAHAAANNLKSLALAFAATASADSGQPKVPGESRKLN